jgi:mRNA-degrading endonuclease toxin of MazEF toxin-antitoxin module
MQPERGDVVRSSDPFKLGDDKQRPWLIVSTESHPFDGEQYIAVAISTKSTTTRFHFRRTCGKSVAFLGSRSSLRGQFIHHGVRTSLHGKVA